MKLITVCSLKIQLQNLAKTKLKGSLKAECKQHRTNLARSELPLRSKRKQLIFNVHATAKHSEQDLFLTKYHKFLYCNNNFGNQIKKRETVVKWIVPQEGLFHRDSSWLLCEVAPLCEFLQITEFFLLIVLSQSKNLKIVSVAPYITNMSVVTQWFGLLLDQCCTHCWLPLVWFAAPKTRVLEKPP